jgi:peptide/nickel transport system substrate-binding protein
VKLGYNVLHICLKAMRSMSTKIFSSFLLAVCLLLSACAEAGDPSAENTPPVRRLVYGLTLLPSGFDPHINASAELTIPLASVYDTLVYRHPQTRAFEAGLAESWQVSADGLRYTFRLRQGVTFHDGQPFNAAAVGVTLDRVLSPETASQKARFLLGPNYQGYSLLDEYTLEISLSAPYAPLLDGLSQVYLGIASPLALANHADGTYQWHQVGTGPYQMVEAVPGDRLVLRRNPAYAWGPAFYTAQNPNPVEEIVFRFYTDPATRDDALSAGEIGFVGELLPFDAELLLSNNDLRVYPTPIAGQPLQFIFNTRQFPLNDVNVRRGLLQATNRRAIVDAVFGASSPVAIAPLTRVTEGYNPAATDFYPYNPSAAIDTLRLSGVTDSDNDGLLDKSGAPLEFTLLAPPWGLIPQTAQALAGEWRSLGVTLNIEQVPNFPALLDRLAQGDYHLAAYYEFGLDPSLLNSQFLSTGLNNFSGVQNPTLDALLTQALSETDPTTRLNLYYSAQDLIMSEALILPLREYVNLNGASADLEGVIFSAQGWSPLLPNFQWRDSAP